MSYTYNHPRPAVTTDAVIFRMNDEDVLSVLLIKRKNDPYKNYWALPGGFLDENETLEKCVNREVEEETGLTNIKFYQLGAFSEPLRDPRHRTITVAYWGFTTSDAIVAASSDAADAQWFEIESMPSLAFDHDEIIKKALVRALEIMAL